MHEWKVLFLCLQLLTAVLYYSPKGIVREAQDCMSRKLPIMEERKDNCEKPSFFLHHIFAKLSVGGIGHDFSLFLLLFCRCLL